MTESILLTSTPPQDGQGGAAASNGSNRSNAWPQSPQRNSYIGMNELYAGPSGCRTGAPQTVAVILPAFLLSRFTRDIVGRSVLVIFLFIPAGAYFGFATVGREVVGASAVWTLVELLQVVVFGTMALIGLRGSPYWLAAGWALHAFWDFLLHYTGPGEAFAPWTYAIACISFDWLVAIYIVVVYAIGRAGDRSRGARRGPALAACTSQGRPDPSEDVERLLTASMVKIRLEDPSHPHARYCLAEYFAELDQRFEAGFDPSVSISADADELTPPRGLLLIATLRSEPIGCGALKFHVPGPTEIKRMWVARSVRGLGIGRRILSELEAEAYRRGSRMVRLETNKSLTEAIAMYRSAGYVEVQAFNDEPYAHHWFEKRLDATPDDVAWDEHPAR